MSEKIQKHFTDFIACMHCSVVWCVAIILSFPFFSSLHVRIYIFQESKKKLKKNTVWWNKPLSKFGKFRKLKWNRSRFQHILINHHNPIEAVWYWWTHDRVRACNKNTYSQRYSVRYKFFIHVNGPVCANKSKWIGNIAHPNLHKSHKWPRWLGLYSIQDIVNFEMVPSGARKCFTFIEESIKYSFLCNKTMTEFCMYVRFFFVEPTTTANRYSMFNIAREEFEMCWLIFRRT